MKYLTRDTIGVRDRHRKRADLRDGASVEFLGIVRGRENGKKIFHLDYEAYPPMAERVMDRLVEEAGEKWPLHRVFLRHRIGRVSAGEVSVAIRVDAPHREEAFEACRFLIDAVKKDVPIWKREDDPLAHVSGKRGPVQRG